jgi:hypothetical protein
VFEDSIVIDGALKKQERSQFLNPLVLPSVNSAISLGKSLAVIRPRNTHFFHKVKSVAQLQEEREHYRLAAAQGSLFDAELAALEPSPYEFKFKFRDEEVPHEYTNGDWEAHAMFYNERNRGKSDTEVLAWMDYIFNEEYPKRGMLFAIGNQAKRPQTWQLLGVLRVDETAQGVADRLTLITEPCQAHCAVPLPSTSPRQGVDSTANAIWVPALGDCSAPAQRHRTAPLPALTSADRGARRPHLSWGSRP